MFFFVRLDLDTDAADVIREITVGTPRWQETDWCFEELGSIRYMQHTFCLNPKSGTTHGT